MTDSTHIIRLRGPWQFTVLARSVIHDDGTVADEHDRLSEPGTVTMPTDWGATLGDDFYGRVRYTRNFNRPTGLEKDDRVQIVVGRADAIGRVWLNGSHLGDIPAGGNPARFSVEPFLQLHNRLEIEVSLPRIAANDSPLSRPQRENLPGGLVGEVRLEITPHQLKMP